MNSFEAGPAKPFGMQHPASGVAGPRGIELVIGRIAAGLFVVQHLVDHDARAKHGNVIFAIDHFDAIAVGP